MKPLSSFIWDTGKDAKNIKKHGVGFEEAQRAFADPYRVFAVDHRHSTARERRLFCFGKVEGRVLTVRFVWRDDTIRIFGAGFWREGRRKYEEANRIRKGSA
jgi:uncharacterized DUF497 family protein